MSQQGVIYAPKMLVIPNQLHFSTQLPVRQWFQAKSTMLETATNTRLLCVVKRNSIW